MKLKSIQLKGFKSFPQKTLLEFEKGINIIIGPNGSGKSNIIDAIRWSVGEKSVKMLRGSSMEDIIFKGAEGMSPSNIAEVTLVFTNEERLINMDSEEVEIKRIYTRDGKGKFLINGKNVRLKEIEKILGNIGLTANGYSIIQQGEIDRFINYSAMEKRIFFEEAAGIIPEKIKKKDTENQLNRTLENLKRIEDIIEEKKKIENGLKRSLSKLKRYKQLKEELIQNKNLFNAKSYLKYKTNAEEYEADNPLLNEKAKLIKEITLLEEKITEINNELEKIWSEEKASTQKKLNLSTQLKTLEGEKNLLNSNIKNAEEVIYSDTNLIKQGEDKIKDYKLKIAKIENSNKIILKEQEENKQQLRMVNDELEKALSDIEQLKKDYQDVEKLYTDFAGQIKDIENEKLKLSTEKSSKENQILMIETRLKNFDKRLQAYNDDLKACKNDLERVNNKFKDFQKKVQELEEKNKKLDEEKTKYQKLYTDIAVKIDLKNERLKLLKESIDNYSVFDSGIKNVMKKARDNKDSLSGIHDVVANLITFSEEYAVALEVAFGKVLQYIICDTEEDAKRSIKYLNRIKGGRVTFIPLKEGQKRINKPFNLPINVGIIGFATDLYQAQEEYKNIIDRFINNVIIVKDMNVASEIKRALRGKYYRIVTLTGEIFYSDGRIVGGRREHEAGILSLKGEMDSLDTEIKEYKKKEEEYRKEFNRIFSEIEKNEGKIADWKQKIDSINSEKLNYEREYETIMTNIKNLEQNKDTENESIKILKNEIQDIEKQLKTIEEKLHKSNKENKELQDKYNEFKKRLDKKHQFINEKILEKNTLINNDQIYQNELNNNRNNLENFKQIIEATKNDIEFFRKEIEEKKQDIIEYKKQIKGKEKEIYEINIKLQTKESDIEKISDKMENLKKEKEKYTKELNIQRNKLEELEEKIADFLQEKQNILVNMQKHYDYLEEYFDDYDKLNQYLDDITYNNENELEELTIKIKEIDEKIDRLGAVNFEAEHEYEIFEKEFKELIDNYNDVLESSKRLQEIIEDVNNRMAEKFGEAVKNINEYFSRTFKELFEGGEAEIVLLQPTDLLETGIDIKVKIPGKNVQSLNLLSTGEKALVTSALIFAIFLQNPTPVCFLDEVDAPMDAVNLVKFFTMLKKYSKNIQFIIITHNKKSMEFADVLYGVTMVKKGVSKVISVKFEEDK